jgi:hypothetical protein
LGQVPVQYKSSAPVLSAESIIANAIKESSGEN